MTQTHRMMFTTATVRALIEGPKTQTRRLVRPQPTEDGGTWSWDGGRRGAFFCGADMVAFNLSSLAVGYAVGDRIIVKESIALPADFDATAELETARSMIRYRADGEALPDGYKRWRAAMLMPGWAARLILDVTAVRVERLHDITEADAAAEGVVRVGTDAAPDERSYRWGYVSLWNRIHGSAAWDENPWVKVITFTVARA